MLYRVLRWQRTGFVCPCGRQNRRVADGTQFFPIFSQELHRAGFCCNGHVHHRICRDSTQSTKPRSNRSVRQMKAPAVYRLLRQPSGTQQSARPASTDRADTLSHQRSARPTHSSTSWFQKHLMPEEAGVATKIAEAIGTSHLLHAEGLRLKHGLSQHEITSVLAMAGTTFKPRCTDGALLETTKKREDLREWEEVVRLSSEHIALRPVVMCRQHRKRDSETKAAIQERYPEIRRELREGYLKVVRRLEAFQVKTALPFPPNCGVFLEW